MNVELTKQIECSCKVCAANAEFLGLSLPLKAVTRATMAKGTEHGLVHLAHDPILSKKTTAVVKAVV
jgi:hypothetical protein